MTIKAVILADDLTGALDSAVGFADKSCRIAVALSPSAIEEALGQDPEVLVINSASREIDPDCASKRVLAVASQLDLTSVPLVFKKVDSRLKGNVAAECAALAGQVGRPRILFCPAIPTMGRVVKDGALQGAGVAQPIAVAEVLDARLRAGVEVPDVASDGALDALCAGAPEDRLWIGARGLAFALARKMGIKAPATGQLRAPVLILNGSRDPVTLAQLTRLGAHSACIEAPDGAVPDFRPGDGSVVLTMTEAGTGLSGPEATARFAMGAARLARQCRFGAILICGGETAQAFLDQFHLNSLQVTAELRPGLPICRAELGWGPVHLVTKSGGFGAPGLLAEILEETGQ